MLFEGGSLSYVPSVPRVRVHWGKTTGICGVNFSILVFFSHVINAEGNDPLLNVPKVMHTYSLAFFPADHVIWNFTPCGIRIA